MEWLMYTLLLFITLLPQHQSASIKNIQSSLSIKRVRRNAILNRKKIWHSKIIPYEIQVKDYQAIESAIKYFNNLTCVKWIPRSQVDVLLPYVIFKSDTLCRSEVGQLFDKQIIYIGSHCNTQPIIVHEMYHVMGFYHEMQRFDRDNFVEIHWENIRPGFEIYFEKIPRYESDVLGETYDITSILHYDSYAYSIDLTKRTISIVNQSEPINSPIHLSDNDIMKVKRLYDCRDDSVPGWSAWSMYSYCNNECKKVRSRFCYSPYNVGADCDNAIDDVETEKQQCTDIECSVDGNWSYWSRWSHCDANICGYGKKYRQRDCNDPKPVLHGKKCFGESKESKLCKLGACTKGQYDCEFDNDVMCRWININNLWSRQRASNDVFGPSTDISFQTGYYMILFNYKNDKHNNQNGRRSIQNDESNTRIGSLEMNIQNLNNQCLKFYYSFGNNASLLVRFYNDDVISKEYKVMQSNNSESDEWNEGKILTERHFTKIQFIGSALDQEDYVALDDIFFSETNQCKNNNVIEVLPSPSNLSTLSTTSVFTSATSTVTRTNSKTKPVTVTTKTTQKTSVIVNKQFLSSSNYLKCNQGLIILTYAIISIISNL